MIFAVIPSIRESVIDVVSNLLDQALPPSKIVVVDNSLGKTKFPNLKELEVIVPRENLGSAGGYAAGISRCLEHKECEFIFSSDDDVLYEKNALFELRKKILELKDAGAVRCAWKGYSGETKEVHSSVWTGVLMKKDVVQKIGLPMKDFFLYGDDVEYFLRMRKHGFKVYIVNQAQYLKREKDMRTKKGIYLDPSRLYYAFRNEIYIGKKYDKKIAIKSIGYFIKNLPFMNRKSIFASLEGIKDGILGNLGKNQKYMIRADENQSR
ncbi:MAG: hypothetical protein NZ927_06795 [Candidatus Calescibacterium sp.]|nr:hypothetical protein [Candidatus Calescibacterium sp.]MCX7734546.1 hypothetical protein [bacterium]MDW8087630.1 hypothetical protein [Candidatus Calescibacterium sp.]